LRARHAPTRKRPFLLVLVYAASLSLVALSGGALALLGSQHVITSSISLVVAADQADVAEFVGARLTAEDAAGLPLTAERATSVEAALADLVRFPAAPS